MNIRELKTLDPEDITEALRQGQSIWYLDTAGTGGDDFFIGPRDEVITEVALIHGPDPLPPHWSLPPGWSLSPVDQETWARLLGSSA